MHEQDIIHNTKYKRKKWPYVLGFFIALALLFAGFLLWVNSTVRISNSASSEKKTFVISSGEGASDIAGRLNKEGLTKNAFVFILYLNYKGLGDDIQAGQYQIPQNLNMIQLAGIITAGKIVEGKITIPEGWTKEQIADRFSETTKLSKSQFLDAISGSNVSKWKSKYDFLADIPEGEGLEGYLYPDTYILSAKPTADELIEKMLDNFGKKFTKNLRDKVGSSGMNTHEVITLASVVEREVAKAEDRKVVAGIFENRLNNDIPLESCATIQYILKVDKKQFTYEETRTPSEYNTYINKGLPKGPIGNPSVDSIEAVLSPQKTDYMYFLTGNDGNTYFSNTLDEHEAKKQLYLR